LLGLIQPLMSFRKTKVFPAAFIA